MSDQYRHSPKRKRQPRLPIWIEALMFLILLTTCAACYLTIITAAP